MNTDKAMQLFRQEANADAWAFRQKEQNPTSRKWKSAYKHAHTRLEGVWQIAVALFGVDECVRIVEEERQRVYGHLPIGANFGKEMQP